MRALHQVERRLGLTERQDDRDKSDRVPKVGAWNLHTGELLLLISIKVLACVNFSARVGQPS